MKKFRASELNKPSNENKMISIKPDKSFGVKIGSDLYEKLIFWIKDIIE